MDRYAVFVDAGYLFAQGSALVSGQAQKKRKFVKLDEKVAVQELITMATNAVPPTVSLLRIYWYDGGHRFPSPEQELLADCNHVKLRLGFINSAGQQKGVDSLIVTDMIDLARNRAITDAVVLSGDEDIRVGVQVAQSLGVRVHLIGIHPARGSQSKQLRQESDTLHEIDKACVSKFLSVMLPPAKPAEPAPVAWPAPAEPQAAAEKKPAEGQAAMAALAAFAEAQAAAKPVAESTPVLKAVAAELLATLTDDDVQRVAALIGRTPGLPGALDGRLLAKCRSALGRILTLVERNTARGEFRQILQARVAALATQ